MVFGVVILTFRAFAAYTLRMQQPPPAPPPIQSPSPMQEGSNGESGVRTFIRAIMAVVTIVWLMLSVGALVLGVFAAAVLATAAYSIVMVVLFVAYFISRAD
jgi:hypothetical protein